MRKYFNILLLLMMASLWNNFTKAQIIQYPTNPFDAKIVYDDIENFLLAFKLLEEREDTVEILQKEYIDKGTPGLKIFIEKYGLTAEKLTKAIQKNPDDYMAIVDRLAWLKTQEDSIRQYFKKFKRFIPDAIFPPTYYLVDIRRGIGSGSIEGQLITIEKEAEKIVDPGIKTHIIHELVHLNQLQAIGSYEKYLAIYKDEKSLLAITLREGIAEFFAELVTGKYTQDEVRLYVSAHEQELWEEFKQEMYGKETGDWMWKTPENSDKPRDVGYVLGAKIVEYYYKQALDMDRAISEILSLTDYREFIKNCEYSNKFISR